MADADLPPPPEGIRVHRNAGNGFLVCRVHYTADADKRSPEWRRKTKQGLDDRGWKREYEIEFETPGGEPVFPEFDPARMVRPCQPIPGARPLRGWDFGHVCPVVLVGQLDVYGRLMILREIVLPASALEVMIDAAKVAVLELWGAPRECYDAGDPSGEKMTDLGQAKQVLSEANILLHTLSWTVTEASYQSLRTLLQKECVAGSEGRTPKFLVDPACPLLIRALSGGFHKSPRSPFKPVDVHPFKDLCDALRYLNHNLLGAQSSHMEKMREVASQDLAW